MFCRLNSSGFCLAKSDDASLLILCAFADLASVVISFKPIRTLHATSRRTLLTLAFVAAVFILLKAERTILVTLRLGASGGACAFVAAVLVFGVPVFAEHGAGDGRAGALADRAVVLVRLESVLAILATRRHRVAVSLTS